MSFYLLLLFLFFDVALSAPRTLRGNECHVSITDTEWTFPDGVIFDCVIRAATSQGSPLDILSDGTLELRQNVGDPDFPITNLRLKRISNIGQPLTAKVYGDITTMGDQTFEVNLDLPTDGDQILKGSGAITIEGEVTKLSAGKLTIETSSGSSISLEKSLTVTDDLIMRGNSLQFQGEKISSINGNIFLEGEFQFTGQIPQTIECTTGILSAISFTKQSSLSGKVTLQAKPLKGTFINGQLSPAGISLSSPGSITISTPQGLEVLSPITTPGSINCNQGPLTLSTIQLIGAAGAGQNVGGQTFLTIGDVTQTDAQAILTLKGPSGITTGIVEVPGRLTVESACSIQSLDAGIAIFKDNTRADGDIRTQNGFTVEGDLTMASASTSTQSVSGGAFLTVNGDVSRSVGHLTLSGVHISVDGHVTVDQGILRVVASGDGPNSQLAKDVTAVGINLSGPCLLSSSSTQTLNAKSGQFEVQPSLSKNKGDLSIKADRFLITGDLSATSGSMTIAGPDTNTPPTSFQSTGNIFAGIDLVLPDVELSLTGSQAQSVKANIGGGGSGTLTSPKAIIKTSNGDLTLSGGYVSLDHSINVQRGGLTIEGELTAKSKLKAIHAINLDGGTIYDNIQGDTITIKNRLTMAGDGPQELNAPNDITCNDRITKAKGNLLINGLNSIKLGNDVSVLTGQLTIVGSGAASIYTNLKADSMDLSDLLLVGSSQKITAGSILAKQMVKTTEGDVTVEVSTMLQIKDLWQSTNKKSSMNFRKISVDDTPSFTASSDLRSGAGIVIEYPVTLTGLVEQQIAAVTSLACKDVTKTLADCRMVGPNGVEVLGSSIDIFGALTVEGPFTSNVGQIQVGKRLTLQKSCTLTSPNDQRIQAASFALGLADVGGMSKQNGNLNFVLTEGIILIGDVTVYSGALDISGSKTADIHSMKIQAASISINGFTSGLNLVDQTDTGTQSLKATNGDLVIGGKISKSVGTLELSAEGETSRGITISGDISAGVLICNSFLKTSANEIVVQGNMEFHGALELESNSMCRLNVGDTKFDNQLVVEGGITKAMGDLSILNRYGDAHLKGDVTLNTGTLTINSKAHIYKSLIAANQMEFQQTVTLQGEGSQSLTSRNVLFNGENPVEVTKDKGDLFVGDPNSANSQVSFSLTGSLSAWGGALTVYGSLKIGQDVWADGDLTLGNVEMVGTSRQSVISMNGCLKVTGRMIKDTQFLYLGSDNTPPCIELGELTQAKNGRIISCGQGASDPCQTYSCKCIMQTADPDAPCRSAVSRCPEALKRPTAAPTKKPTVKITLSPTKVDDTPRPTAPTTDAPTGKDFVPTQPPVGMITRRPTAMAAKVGESSPGLGPAAIVGIIVVVLAIPGITILIWLCLRNRSKDGDREVLLSDDVGEYKAPEPNA